MFISNGFLSPIQILKRYGPVLMFCALQASAFCIVFPTVRVTTTTSHGKELLFVHISRANDNGGMQIHEALKLQMEVQKCLHEQLKVKGEPNISYICSRFYRAPELIFGPTEYTTAIDICSAGCVFAELLLGQSGVDQLVGKFCSDSCRK